MSGRSDGWEVRLARMVERARSRPFAWGTHDCGIWAFGVLASLRCEDSLADWRGTYSTEIGAGRVMLHHGWRSLEDAMRDLLGVPMQHHLMAQRGDLVLGGDPEGCGVCLGNVAAFVGQDGLMEIPLAECRLAWRS